VATAFDPKAAGAEAAATAETASAAPAESSQPKAPKVACCLRLLRQLRQLRQLCQWTGLGPRSREGPQSTAAPKNLEIQKKHQKYNGLTKNITIIFGPTNNTTITLRPTKNTSDPTRKHFFSRTHKKYNLSTKNITIYKKKLPKIVLYVLILN
jgi:hypothetical protein